jgi:coenzyme Q-binding protein COQ10
MCDEALEVCVAKRTFTCTTWKTGASAMPEFTTRRRVPYTPAEMYALVADVERYPEFLPLCEALTVRARGAYGDGEQLIADMHVGYQMVRERIGSRVTLDPFTPAVTAENVDGPFTHMINRWRFTPVGNGCEIEFYITYTFKSMMLQVMVGGLFEQAYRAFADAFEQRARAIYGPR